MKRKGKLAISIATVVFAVLCGMTVYAQDKHTLKSPDGIAFSDFDASSDNFTADPSPSDCGHVCHVAVKAKDHIFHTYRTR